MTANKTKHNPRILFIATFPPPIHGSAVVSEQIRNSKVINEAFNGDYVNLGTSRKMDEIGNGGLWIINYEHGLPTNRSNEVRDRVWP